MGSGRIGSLSLALVLAANIALWELALLTIRMGESRPSAWICLGGLAFLFFAAWTLRLSFDPRHLFLAVLTVQFLLVLTFTPARGIFLSRFAVFLVLPVALIRSRSRFVTPGMIALIFIGFLIGDLATSLVKSKPLLGGTPSPALSLGADTRPSSPIFPTVRFPAPTYPRYELEQDPRYLPLLRHRAYAFSAGDPPERGSRGPKDYFVQMLHSRRWNSFLLSRHYQELVHSGEPVEKLLASFAIGKPLLQARGPIRFSVESYSYDELTLRAAAEDSGEIYWSDGYDPSWRGWDGKKPIEILRENTAFKAVRLGAGVHYLQFRYLPLGFLFGLAVFYGTIFGVLFVVGALLYRSAPSHKA